MIPVLALMIPIVAILSAHQQKMASIMREGGNSQTSAELAALREEVRNLRELVATQMLAMDSMSSNRLSDSMPVQDRVRNGL